MITLNRKQKPGITSVDSFNLILPQKHVLDNGIPVYSINSGIIDVVKIDLVFPAGSWYQPQRLVAHAVNNLMKEGTANFSSEDIAEKLDFYGAFLETGSSKDNAYLTLYSLNKHLPELMPVLEEMVKHPLFPEHETAVFLQRERQNYIINSQKVKYLVRRKFDEVVFGKTHPYGKIMNLDSFDLLDKSVFADFHRRHYDAKHCRMVISGKVESSVVKLLNQHFGGSDWFTEDNNLASAEYEIHPDAEHYHKISMPDAVQSAIRMGKPWVTRTHPDFAGLQFLNTVFGGYFGSRLMANIREDKGYTYGIGSTYYSYLKTGIFRIVSEVGADVADKAVEEIKTEINKLRQETIKKKELNLVRNYVLGSFLRGIDGPFELGNRFRTVMEFGEDMDFYRRYLDVIQSITAQQLLDLAQEYLNEEEMWLVMAGK